MAAACDGSFADDVCGLCAVGETQKEEEEEKKARWLTLFRQLHGNPLPIKVGGEEKRGDDSRDRLSEIFAGTTALRMIRDEAATLAIGLQDLELPALVTLEIIDAAFPNSIPMHKKWDLVVAVKHFRERRLVNE